MSVLKLRHGRSQIEGATPERQKGISIVLITIALVALIGMSGLALDGGHLMLNKTRLQNTVDAAALSAAKVVDQTAGDIDAGRQAAFATFADNAAGSGNTELAEAYGDGNGDINVTVQFSATVDPFTPGSAEGPFVRVIATDFRLPIFLARIVGLNDKRVAASAVAGPSPPVNPCRLVPLSVCGDAGAGAPLYGLEPSKLYALKLAGGDTGGQNDPPEACEIGPGNFQLLRLEDPGADAVRQALAGDFQGCPELGGEVETQPGNEAGPIVQGLNTRFGEYSGPMGGTQDEFPPDVVVASTDPGLTYEENDKKTCSDDTIEQSGSPVEFSDEIDFNFADYEAAVEAGQYDHAPPAGEFDRRKLVVPVLDCSVGAQGQSTMPLLGFACYFLLQPAVQKGNEAQIFGEFIDACNTEGTPTQNEETGSDPIRIQLYNDPDSWDS